MIYIIEVHHKLLYRPASYSKIIFTTTSRKYALEMFKKIKNEATCTCYDAEVCYTLTAYVDESINYINLIGNTLIDKFTIENKYYYG